jgi:malonate transporter and related proteins
VNYAQLLFPDFSLILCGFLICRYTALDRGVWEPVERLVYFFLFPVLLFHSIARTHLDWAAASELIQAGLCLGVFSVSLTYALPHLPWLKRYIPLKLHAASAQVGFRFNSFIALALADRLAGAQGVLQIAILIGVCVPLFNVAAVWPMSRHAQGNFLRELVRNPLIIATTSGLLANVFNLQIPSWADPSLQRIGAASLALGLMAAGAGMAMSSLAKAKTLAVAVLTVRHLATPLMAWELSRLMGLNPLQTQIFLAFSALPTASSAYVLASRMGYDGTFVAALVTLSTLLGMLSLPFALSFVA